jgi:hypothetical protein
MFVMDGNTAVMNGTWALNPMAGKLGKAEAALPIREKRAFLRFSVP